MAERFFKTLKDQIIHGRIYRTVAEVRLQHDKAVLAEDADRLATNVKNAAGHIKDAFTK